LTAKWRDIEDRKKRRLLASAEAPEKHLSLRHPVEQNQRYVQLAVIASSPQAKSDQTYATQQLRAAFLLERRTVLLLHLQQLQMSDKSTDADHTSRSIRFVSHIFLSDTFTTKGNQRMERPRLPLHFPVSID